MSNVKTKGHVSRSIVHEKFQRHQDKVQRLYKCTLLRVGGNMHIFRDYMQIFLKLTSANAFLRQVLGFTTLNHVENIEITEN